MGEVVVGMISIGVGIILGLSSERSEADAGLLHCATTMEDLKELEEYLEKKPLEPIVMVHGTVGSTSTVETKHCSNSCVFVEETASLQFKRMTDMGYLPEFTRIVVKREEVPWYLDDGTARVNVMGVQNTRGFDVILKTNFFKEPIPADCKHCECCEEVLEIGTDLTVVGFAKRDKDGAPMIGETYLVYNGRKELNKLVYDLESYAESNENFSLFLVAMGMVLLVGSLFRNDMSMSKSL